METKTCSKCGNIYPANWEYFFKQPSHKDGLKSECKKCSSKRMKQRYEKKKEEDHVYKKEYYQKNRDVILKKIKAYADKNCEKIAADNKRWREVNKESLKIKASEYYEANKEAKNKYKSEWAKKNRHRCNENYRRRILMEKQLPSTLTKYQWEEIKKYFNGACAYCGRKSPLTVDHVLPVTKGGELSINNVVPACKSCNSSKATHTLMEWYGKYRYYDEAREQKILSFLGYNNGVQQLKLG